MERKSNQEGISEPNQPCKEEKTRATKDLLRFDFCLLHCRHPSRKPPDNTVCFYITGRQWPRPRLVAAVEAFVAVVASTEGVVVAVEATTVHPVVAMPILVAVDVPPSPPHASVIVGAGHVYFGFRFLDGNRACHSQSG